MGNTVGLQDLFAPRNDLAGKEQAVCDLRALFLKVCKLCLAKLRLRWGAILPRQLPQVKSEKRRGSTGVAARPFHALTLQVAHAL